MRAPTQHRETPTYERLEQEAETSRERAAVAARRAAHRRWVDDDTDDPACRGID